MNFKQARKTLKTMKRRASGDKAEALAIAIEQLVQADRNREAEIDKAVDLIRDAVFDSDDNLHESAWSYIKDRIDFPPEDKAEIIRRLGLDVKK